MEFGKCGHVAAQRLPCVAGGVARTVGLAVAARVVGQQAYPVQQRIEAGRIFLYLLQRAEQPVTEHRQRPFAFDAVAQAVAIHFGEIDRHGSNRSASEGGSMCVASHAAKGHVESAASKTISARKPRVAKGNGT